MPAMDVLILIAVIIVSYFLYLSFNKSRYPPGPVCYPVIGNGSLIKKLAKKHGGFHNALMELCKFYKTDILSLKFGGDYTVVVQSEQLLKEVLTNDVFQARPDNLFIRLRSMGKRVGITMTDGPLWCEQRAFAFKHMHELGLGRRRMDDMIQKQLQDMLPTLEKCEVSSIHLRKFLSMCVLNVLWEMVSGESFKNKEQKLNDLVSFMEQRAKAFDVSGGTLGQFPFLRFICPEYSGYNLIQRLNEKFRFMIMEIINDHKEKYSPNITKDFIDAFLHEMYLNRSPFFNDEQLIMVCLDFFIAGSQTTSSTLDFLFLHMILYPEIQEKVQQELDSILKPGEIPSAQDRLKCPYVDAVILESQRLSSVAPVIGPRRALHDTSLGGYFIPKNTTILLNLVPYHQNSEIWKDADIMKPERFLDDTGRVTGEQRLFSFGKGKRRCPGESLARNFLFIFFAGVLFNYKILPQDKRHPPRLKVVPGITLSPAEYHFKMIKRF